MTDEQRRQALADAIGSLRSCQRNLNLAADRWADAVRALDAAGLETLLTNGVPHADLAHPVPAMMVNLDRLVWMSELVLTRLAGEVDGGASMP